MSPTASETLDLRAVVVELRSLLGQLRRKLKEQGDPGDFSLAQTGALKHLVDDHGAKVEGFAGGRAHASTLRFTKVNCKGNLHILRGAAIVGRPDGEARFSA